MSGLLFNLFINDLPNCLQYCKRSMYADDAKIYAPLTDTDSRSLIQRDLDALDRWCSTWRMRLNVQKCFALHYKPIGRESGSPHFNIGGTPLVNKTSTLDLGIIMSNDLKFHEQVSNACSKANKEINNIRRTFVSRNPAFLSEMFKIFVRPQMEYCISLWNPVYSRDVDKLEKVQNRFTRLLRYGTTMTPSERNAALGITDHQSRRARGDLISVYKLFDSGELFNNMAGERTRGHSKKLRVDTSNNNIRQHSFAVRTINAWNALPQDVVSTTTLNSFKARLDDFMLAP